MASWPLECYVAQLGFSSLRTNFWVKSKPAGSFNSLSVCLVAHCKDWTVGRNEDYGFASLGRAVLATTIKFQINCKSERIDFLTSRNLCWAGLQIWAVGRVFRQDFPSFSRLAAAQSALLFSAANGALYLVLKCSLYNTSVPCTWYTIVPCT